LRPAVDQGCVDAGDDRVGPFGLVQALHHIADGSGIGVVLAEILVPGLFERSFGGVQWNFFEFGSERRVARLAATIGRPGSRLSRTGR
jgi:hypothetical protein